MDSDYHFAAQFTADLIAMNHTDFIITSTFQEIAGTEVTPQACRARVTSLTSFLPYLLCVVLRVFMNCQCEGWMCTILDSPWSNSLWAANTCILLLSA